ncbi:spore gernimation protein GerA [Brevibacillus sp. SKDU10]|uniref:spore germination protein n=1 Tax=Brevibacillus sp. SKDU10 TaxID=1247872 RepID=UPI0007C8C47F|nr:spore germination protein [Brevibacillus sp. SKDU10]OAJ74144.1 spore gernimation protein GerA [Brevibacillus sp. SKDU10]
MQKEANQHNQATSINSIVSLRHLLCDYFAKCADVKVETFQFATTDSSVPISFFYCDGLIDARMYRQFVFSDLQKKFSRYSSLEELEQYRSLPVQPIDSPIDLKEIERELFTGKLIITVDTYDRAFVLDISDPPNRSPEESNTEISVKGPKDGFTESVSTNIALIRKRLRSESMWNESFTIGLRSQSQVALLYIKDIIDPRLVEEVRHRLTSISADALVSSSQLGEALGDSSYSLFPLLDYIGRPDYAVQSLLRGRFIIFIEGSPMALIGPTNLLMTLKSPEDAHFPFYFVTFERILRLLGLIVSIFTPGFWTALISFNVEQLPFPLLATVTTARVGLPLSSSMEMFLMLGLFEIFREAGVRLPKAVGQTVAVVGGLIVGDASIRAGLGSPTTLVVAAVTAVATFTLVNQSLSGTVSVLRIFVLIVSSFLGMYGFFLSLLSIVLYLSTQESFGLPYLAPISPPTFGDMLQSLIALPLKAMRKRPKILHTTDPTRQGSDEA